MDDDYEEVQTEELFNDDFDDSDTLLKAGVRKHMCPEGHGSLDYRVEGRFVVRTCAKCGYEEED